MTTRLRNRYPFSAVVGQDAMKTALLVNGVDPSIGGVLIRGEKGTAKSTAARGFVQLLPTIEVIRGCAFHCDPHAPDTWEEGCRSRFGDRVAPETEERATPVVELPLNATEDRLVGALHVEQTLRSGERRFEPGLLASAHQGVLYVDEVNLLEDHLVDMILDAAASGVNTVEREGVSFTHAARFLLVGTMNPEEGELRPQFLDRFGLCVSIEGLPGAEDRREVIRRRLAFEADPAGFCARWADEEAMLARQVEAARARVGSVGLPEEALEATVRLVTDLEVAGHRGDVAVLKTARALAALMEEASVRPAHVAEAARLALAHRAQNNEARTPEAAVLRVERALERVGDSGREGATEAAAVLAQDDDYWDEQMTVPGPHGAPGMLFPFLKKKRASSTSTR